MSAVMDQRGGRPRRKRIKAGTIELLCRLIDGELARRLSTLHSDT
jgi:hypothetical protein